MNIQEAVRERIVELAGKKKLSVNKIAVNCDMTTSTLQNILYGNSKKSEITTISKICFGLGVTIKEFFDSHLFDNIDYLDN